MIATLLTLLTSGAGGGIVGGIFGLFKTASERKERLEMKRLQIERDRLDKEIRESEMAHELAMVERQGEIALQQTEAEVEGEVAAEHMESLGQAQRFEFSNLQTSMWMDNLRASVRPVFAYYVMVVFSGFLFWAFAKFATLITPDQGAQILLSLVATLTFMVTSITSFYYVSRNNAKPT